MNLNHRCAVCWERQDSHDDWYEHAREQHDALLDEFGYHGCRPQEDPEHVCRAGGDCRRCPGHGHAQRLPNFGVARTKKAAPEPQPFKARDGTVYTPTRLPLDAA